MTPAARLAAAIELLAEIEAAPRRPADAVANEFFRARRFIGSGDRRAVSERVWRVLRAGGGWPGGWSAPAPRRRRGCSSPPRCCWRAGRCGGRGASPFPAASTRPRR